MIESYFLQDVKPTEIAKRINCAVQTIYTVVNQFKLGTTTLEYWNQYKEKMDFRETDQSFISTISNRRNHIPRKSLNYQTPVEIFLSYVQEEFYFNLI